MRGEWGEGMAHKLAEVAGLNDVYNITSSHYMGH